MIYQDTINAKIFIKLLKRLIKDVGHKIFLIDEKENGFSFTYASKTTNKGEKVLQKSKPCLCSIVRLFYYRVNIIAIKPAL